MNIMRINILPCIIFLSLFAACNKDDGLTTGYIKGKTDGVAFETTTNLSANSPEKIGNRDDPTLRISGEWAGNSIRLYILGEASSIGQGTYPFTATDQRSATLVMGGINYYAGPTGILNPGLLGSGSITITSISKKSVSGLFQFTSNPATGNSKTITDGEFSLSRN
jgi:hypothetical protein